MKIQKLYSYTRQAIKDYDMIQEGDRIAVGLSGGKDSLTLLMALHGLQKFYPKHFELMAITCEIGFPGMDFTPAVRFCEELGIPCEIIHTQIREIVFEKNADERPCSLCAKLRKGALYTRLKELGFNKIAYAHNKEDFMETALMSLIFEGRFYAFPPVTYLPEVNVTVIRPLMYVSEGEAEGFARDNQLPIVKNTCPVDGSTKRAYARELLNQISREHPGSREKIFHAVLNGNFPDWPCRERAQPQDK